MKKRIIPKEENERTTTRNTNSKVKKPYHSPRLTRYGNLSQLTKAKPGTKQDGPGGLTKA
jgi:hypothetical protein